VTVSELARMIDANREYAATFSDSGRPVAPARRVAILTCMDSRVHLESALGLEIGDAHMIRNAGGRASDDAIRSLIISSHLLGTNEFAVIHHTDCGLEGLSNDQVRARLGERAGAEATEIDFLPFSDLRQSVIEDVRRILEAPQIEDSIAVSGYVYDVHSGALELVVPATTRATA
jgi:carbonic anhydrase